MFNPKSDYALNKLDQDAIVCPSVTGVHTRLTREAFDTEEEFCFWKAFSDGDYQDTEAAGRSYYDKCVSLGTAQKIAAQSAEDDFFFPLLSSSQKQQKNSLLQQIKVMLTDIQYRRLWMLCVEEKSVDLIAALEGVSPRAIYLSIAKAKEIIVNNL